MERGRYTGYRGKPRGQDVLRLLLALLLLVLLVVAAGLVFAQRYIIYTDDGIRLELPFFRREPAAEEPPPISLDVVQRPDPSEEHRTEGEDPFELSP